MIALSLVINLGAFVIARNFVSDLPAAAVGVAASTVIKYLSLDRLTFRRNREAAPDAG